MSTIANDTAAKFNYALKYDEDNILEQCPEGQPLAYLHGHSNTIPGLEAPLGGQSAGESFNAVDAAAAGHGVYQEQAVQHVPRQHLQGVDDIHPGMQFQS